MVVMGARVALVRWLAAVAVLAAGFGGTASCVTLFGVDELRYAPAAGGAGGAVAGGGRGGAASGGGGGITSSCASPDCATCRQSSCALDACADTVGACLKSQDCLALASCIGACGQTDGDCISDCMKAHPSSVDDYYAASDCTACGPQTCAAQCQETCQGCSEGAVDCQSCINGSCAQPRCPARVEACTGGTECDAYMQCLIACNGDPACVSDCGAQSPHGAEQYVDLAFCVYCVDSTCRSVCQSEQQIDCGALAAEQWGVEICNDGIDDDGDGLVDCDDPDCTGQPGCS